MTAFPSTIVTNLGYRSSHQNRLGKNKFRQYAKHTLPSPTRRSSGWSDQMPRSSAYWHKYEGGPSLLGWLGTSYKVTWASTQWCLEVSSRPWPKAFGMEKPIMLGRRSYSKKPSMTFNKQVSPKTTLTQSNHSKKPLQGIKKIGGKLTSISHAKMEQGESRNGSKGWTEGRWQGTQ